MAPSAASTACVWPKALAQKGADVTVFLMADAVACAKAGQKVPQGYYNLELIASPADPGGGCPEPLPLGHRSAAEAAGHGERLRGLRPDGVLPPDTAPPPDLIERLANLAEPRRKALGAPHGLQAAHLRLLL